MQELQYPTWAIVLFISLIVLAIAPVPVVFLLRYFNVIEESSRGFSAVSYKKGRIITERPRPGEGRTANLIRGEAPGEAPSPADRTYRKENGGGGAPGADALPNGSYGVSYLMVEMPDVPESDL